VRVAEVPAYSNRMGRSSEKRPMRVKRGDVLGKLAASLVADLVALYVATDALLLCESNADVAPA
jgi:hypothetical protein